MHTNFFNPGEQTRLDWAPPPPNPDIMVRADVRPDTAYHLDSFPARPEWGYEQHRFTNTSGVNRYAGEGLYIDTDMLDASYSNPVPITTSEGEVLAVDAARTDRYDFTYAHSLSGGRALICKPGNSWGPWMNHIWGKCKANCVIKWNDQL